MKFSLNCCKIHIRNELNSLYYKVTLFCIFLFVIGSLISGNILKSFLTSLALLFLFISLLILLSIVGFLCGSFYRIHLFKDSKTTTRKNNTKDTFVAVLISNSQSRELGSNPMKRMLKNCVTNMNMCSVYILSKYFRERKCNYVLLEKVTEQDLDNIIEDRDCEEIYLIGHGSRGSFVTSNKIVEYSKYINCGGSKRIVSQLHCNHYRCEGNNLSLTEILALEKDNSYLTSGYSIFLEHLWYYSKLWLTIKYT